MIKQKKAKLKRSVAIVLSAITITAGCALSASAAVQRAQYKVECASKDSCTFIFNAKKAGTQSDVFDSYMTIFNGKESSSGKVVAKFPGGNNQEYPYTFYSCANHYTFRYGNVSAGKSTHQYINSSGGGFRGYCTTSQTY